jgi:hypothetical protein
LPLVEPQFSSYKTAGGFKQFEQAVINDGKITIEELLKNKYEKSPYNPSDEEKDMRKRILKDFQLGVTNMWTPRVEFNDLAVIQRMMVDQQSWNTYQPNNGLGMSQDDIQGWRSHAMRPVVRNKCISIAAHATARLIFPKVFAETEGSNQQDAAQVMEDLMEWAAEESNYKKTALYRTISALTDPASIGYTEYSEVYRSVKDEKKNGKWSYKVTRDRTFPCFNDVVVPTDELYIENFYEPDIQKQGFLIWRRVISYSLAKAKYGSIYPKFNELVRPGVQTFYSDANTSFYFVYDPIMRQYDAEELIYWNKGLDVKIIMVNGVIINEPDDANPRLDKLYPFDKFGYELINNRCFYYKSLAFKTMQDANIVNTLYPMIIDGTYLQIMPPMVNQGAEAITSDVIVPGSVTNLATPGAQLNAIMPKSDLKAGLESLQKVEDSLNESSQSETEQGQKNPTPTTAYEISRIEQNAATVLGLFIQMIAQHVRDFGKLRLGDILQYLTIADAENISDDKPLVYKTFLMHDKKSEGTTKNRKIKFDDTLPDEPISGEKALGMSYYILQEQGGLKADTELWKVNPTLFRELKYSVTISPDILNPRSEDLERAYSLETYDRMVQNPSADPEETLKLLLSTDPKTKRDPDKYLAKQQPMVTPQDQMLQAMGQSQGQQSQQGQPNASQKPQNGPGQRLGPQSKQLLGRTPLPQVPSTGIM